MNDLLHKFVEDGFCELGNIIDDLECDNLLQKVKDTREFSSNLFLRLDNRTPFFCSQE